MSKASSFIGYLISSWYNIELVFRYTHNRRLAGRLAGDSDPAVRRLATHRCGWGTPQQTLASRGFRATSSLNTDAPPTVVLSERCYDRAGACFKIDTPTARRPRARPRADRAPDRAPTARLTARRPRA